MQNPDRLMTKLEIYQQVLQQERYVDKVESPNGFEPLRWCDCEAHEKYGPFAR